MDGARNTGPALKDVLFLERVLWSGRYTPGRYKTIEVFDPKHRVVSAAPFRDRVVQHALCAVVEPLFERGFIHDSYANRKGKGTHRAVARYERFRDRFRHVLRCDIYWVSPFWPVRSRAKARHRLALIRRRSRRGLPGSGFGTVRSVRGWWWCRGARSTWVLRSRRRGDSIMKARCIG